MNLIEINPTGKNEVNPLYLPDLLGFIPSWLDNPVLRGESAKEALEKQYIYGSMYENEESTVSSDGTMSYPGDPDLYPLVKTYRGEEVIYIYHYGLVSIVSKSGFFCTRMD